MNARAEYDQGWDDGNRGIIPDGPRSKYYTQGWFAGYGTLLADERRMETAS